MELDPRRPLRRRFYFVLAKHKLEVEKGFDLTLDRATGELTVGVRVYNAENIAAHLGNWMSTQ